MHRAPAPAVSSRRRTLRRMLAAGTVVVALAAGTTTPGTAAAAAGPPQPTTTTLTISPQQGYEGTPVTVTATVSASVGVPSGVVAIEVPGLDWVGSSVPLVDGVGSLVLEGLGPGTFRVTATYLGHDDFAASADLSWEHLITVAPAIAPFVDHVQPSAIVAGREERVWVYGTRFAGASVTFGGVPVTPVTETSYFVSFVIPAHPAGSYPVVVTTPDGTSTPITVTVVDTTDGMVSQVPARIDSEQPRVDWPTCLDVAGQGTVPVGAAGVILNVTTTQVSEPGYVVVFPRSDGGHDGHMPTTSTVNFEPGSDVANTAFVALNFAGFLCYRASHPGVRVLLDVTGFTMPSSGVELLDPVRLLDTRTSTPVAPGIVRTVQVSGQAGVPADATAVIVNATVTGTTGLGNLRVFPAGTPVPTTSVVNYVPGKDKANATIVPLSSSGKLSFVSDTGGSTAHVILDVAGYVTDGSVLQGSTPTRILDTRPGGRRVGAQAGPLQATRPYTVEIPSALVPAGASSVVLNVTAIGPSALGNLRVYPSGAAEVPEISTLNYVPGRDIPNLVVVDLPDTGPATVTLFSDMAPGGTVHVAADVVGFVAAP